MTPQTLMTSQTLMALQRLMALVLCVLIVISCQNESATPVYQPGRTWKFTVKNSLSEKLDTLTLSVFDERWHITQTKIVWRIARRDSNGSSVTEEQTGVIDRSNNIVGKNEIWLHPPRQDYLRLTELVAFPSVIVPVTQGQVIKNEVTPDEGWEELEGTHIKGTITVDGKVLYKGDVLRDSCLLLQAVGESEVGKYSAVYYFHPVKGFVYFFYDFKQYTCEIDLVSTNF